MKRPAYMGHRKGEPWTMPQLRSVADEWHRGATLREIAATIGIGAGGLRNTLHAAGFEAPGHRPSVTAKPRREREQWQKQVEKAYRLRAEGVMTWEQVADTIGWRGRPDSLRMAVRRYEGRIGLSGFRGLSRNGAKIAAEQARANGRMHKARGQS